jgi:hypothetical protein
MVRQAHHERKAGLCKKSNIKSTIDPYKYFSANVGSSINVDDKEPNHHVKNMIFFLDHTSITKIELLNNIFRACKKQIIFVCANEASQVLNKNSKALQYDKLQPQSLPTHSNYYLDNYKSDPLMLLINDEFKQSIMKIIQHRIEFMHSLGTQIYVTDYEEIDKKINIDINLLKHKNLLTSNLAIHFYNLTFFKIKTNQTKIGNYFRDGLGIKSKTFSKNSKKLKNFQLSTVKSFKAYDLSIDMKMQIKLDIASRLIQFIKSNPNKELDAPSIATITELSEEEVEEIFDALQTDKITRPL